MFLFNGYTNHTNSAVIKNPTAGPKVEIVQIQEIVSAVCVTTSPPVAVW